jgi:hypothetical protein
VTAGADCVPRRRPVFQIGDTVEDTCATLSPDCHHIPLQPKGQEISVNHNKFVTYIPARIVPWTSRGEAVRLLWSAVLRMEYFPRVTVEMSPPHMEMKTSVRAYPDFQVPACSLSH